MRPAHGQVDKGAVKFVLGGANVFCGGLISGGAKMDVELRPGQPVIIMVEGSRRHRWGVQAVGSRGSSDPRRGACAVAGKEHACAVGMVKMTPEEIRANPKGVAIDNIHYLGDGLWVEPKVA